VSWTYSHEPDANDRDWVRWKVTDTDEADKLVEDEEIDAELAGQPSKALAAVAVARVIARKFARLASGQSIGKLSEQYAERARLYAALVDKLEEEVGAGAAAGHTSMTDLRFAW